MHMIYIFSSDNYSSKVLKTTQLPSSKKGAYFTVYSLVGIACSCLRVIYVKRGEYQKQWEQNTRQ